MLVWGCFFYYSQMKMLCVFYRNNSGWRVWRGNKMSKILASWLLIWAFFSASTAAENDYSRCNCDDDGEFWTTKRISEWQKAGDFFTALAYFSIPIELLYFVTCTNAPFKLVFVEFIAFIVLCGMTHFLTAWSSYSDQPSHLALALTIFKVLTALVSFATSLTLFSHIPLLLKVKIREFLLRKKAWDLGREVGMIRKQKEAGWHVRMLTQEIRKSLDRHTILYTTLVELSKTLDLQNCAIWMPSEDETEMELTHEVKGRSFLDAHSFPIPILDTVVQEIKRSDELRLLDPDTALAVASSGGGDCEPGGVAAIRMPMLRVANFKVGSPELASRCYAILVLVMPSGHGRFWGSQETEIVKVVADQVAVAISHAAVLEESQNMRLRLAEQNRALQKAQQDALRANQARNAFQVVMSNGMRRPMHSISGLLSVLQNGQLNTDQKLLVDSLVKTGNVVSTLINDVMDTSKESGRFQIEMTSFKLHSLIKEAVSLAKCLCVVNGYEFVVEVDKSLPNHVIGNETRVFQVLIHMVGNLLKNGDGGRVTFCVERDSRAGKDSEWRPKLSSWNNARVRFEIGIVGKASHCGEPSRRREAKEVLSFNICQKLVQLMDGNISAVPNRHKGFDQSMAVVLEFRLRPPDLSMSESLNHLKRLNVLLADHDDVNKAVTRRLLEKLGCVVSTVSNGYECLGALVSPFQVVVLDLHLPDLDGFEVAMRIRKFRSHSWPLIIALSSSEDEDVRKRCIRIGINGVVRKPVILKGIADELTRVLFQ